MFGSNARFGGRLIRISSILKHVRFSSKQVAESADYLPITSFGFKEVDKEEKEGMVREVFLKVAPTYDLMNDIMSAGVHRIWKDSIVSKLGVFPGMIHVSSRITFLVYLRKNNKRCGSTESSFF